VIGEVGGGLGHVAAVAGRVDAPLLAGEGDDEPLAAARAQSEGESEAEDAALEIAAELLLDMARHGPLGGFPPRQPALEVLGDDLVEPGRLSSSPRCVRIFRIGPGFVMNAISRMARAESGWSPGHNSISGIASSQHSNGI